MFMMSRIGEVVTPEQAAEAIYRGYPRPKNWRNATIAIVNRLAIKLDDHTALYILRATRLGRGMPALYCMQQKGPMATLPPGLADGLSAIRD